MSADRVVGYPFCPSSSNWCPCSIDSRKRAHFPTAMFWSSFVSKACVHRSTHVSLHTIKGTRTDAGCTNKAGWVEQIINMTNVETTLSTFEPLYHPHAPSLPPRHRHHKTRLQNILHRRTQTRSCFYWGPRAAASSRGAPWLRVVTVPSIIRAR